MAGSAVAAAVATQGLVGWSSSASVPHSQCAVVNVEQAETRRHGTIICDHNHMGMTLAGEQCSPPGGSAPATVRSVLERRVKKAISVVQTVCGKYLRVACRFCAAGVTYHHSGQPTTATAGTRETGDEECNNFQDL